MRRPLHRRIAYVLLVLASFALCAAAAASDLPGTGISYWKARRGEIRHSFRFVRAKTKDGHDLSTARSKEGAATLRLIGPRTDLACIALDVDLVDVRLFGSKVAEYLDPPVRKGTKSALGGTHARTVLVRQPRPYAFRSRKGESAAGRAINRNMWLLAELARMTLRDYTRSRSRKELSSGVLMFDPYLDWIVERISEAILDGPRVIRRSGRVVEIEVDARRGVASLRIYAKGLREVVGEGAYRRLAEPVRSRGGSWSYSGSQKTLERLVRAARGST